VNEFQITGLNEVVRDLSNAGRSIKGRAAIVTEKSIDDITSTMKSIVPVNEGDTRDSITGEVIEEAGRVVGISGPTTRHAPFLEWGTSVMPPYAFAGPSLDRHSGDYVRDLEQEAGDVWR
jgi:HK97 gp10 family phage protein